MSEQRKTAWTPREFADPDCMAMYETLKQIWFASASGANGFGRKTDLQNTMKLINHEARALLAKIGGAP